MEQQNFVLIVKNVLLRTKHSIYILKVFGTTNFVGPKQIEIGVKVVPFSWLPL